MQIYALNHNSHSIHARAAERGVNYTCPECLKEVRKRGGLKRQPHFYHPVSTSCILQGKSLTHLQIQNALQNMLYPEEILLEHRFPEIGRIADLVWPSQKLVFEVQVSPIEAEEVLARNRDYATLGYQVVWILHDHRYNRSRITNAEVALRFSPHYFTNITSSGRGFFYDQYAPFHLKKRKQRSKRFAVCFKQLFPVNLKQLPSHFPETRKRWPFSFEGDLFQQTMDWLPPPKKEWTSTLIRFFCALHNHLLEKTTY